MYSEFIDYIEQVFDLFQDGIWISDPESRCLFVNRKYEELSGFSKESMIGRKATSIQQEGIFSVAVNPEVIETGRPVSKIQKLSNGRYLSLDGYPVIDDKGRVLMCVTFIKDVSTIIDMQSRLSHQQDLLKTFIRINNTSMSETEEDGSSFIESSAMGDFMSRTRSIAQTDVSILILGETGVGKDVMAQRVHALSKRSSRPFIKVDCGSIAPGLIESELFGYVGGAFSGASKSGRIGLIEAASGGTVFFDEVGELPLTLQTRLLRFLQDGEIVRVGANTPRKIDVRVIAATNKDLEKAVAKGEFRNDLYYRLKIAVLNIPPLRRRKEDILPMAEYFLNGFCRRYGRPVSLSEGAKNVLLAYDWPGNVRELKNLMQETVVTCPGAEVRSEHLSISASGSDSSSAAEEGIGADIDFTDRDYHDVMRELESRM
ncbi:MAG: sigma 54-interacting transcriptional regulator, partial [Mailhella sp.]|nr:sigma 54-interacting transcriptional regulator [Mailhella sp.]